MSENNIIDLKCVSKTFGGIEALKGVDLSVRKGDVHGIVGENGAGKSTLMNIVAGIYTPDSGEINYQGEDIRSLSINERQKLGISMIHQEVTIFQNLCAARNIFLNNEPKNRLGFIDYELMAKKTMEFFKEFKVVQDPRVRLEALSVAERQLLQIIKAVSFNAKLIIMDEPNTALTDEETARLFGIIDYLKSKGVTVIYISHRLEEVLKIADHISVLRDGECVETFSRDEANMPKLIKAMIGRDMKNIFPPPVTKELDEDKLLELKQLSAEGFLKDISLSVRRGEILGLAGLQGAGRTVLAECIIGDRKFQGNMFLEGNEFIPKSTTTAIKKGIVYLPAERRDEALFPEKNIAYNVILPSLEKAKSNWLVDSGKINTIVKKQVDVLDIKTPSIMQLVLQLSGGNQQKTVFARILTTEPKMIILNEPTRGIDVGSKYEIYLLMQELSRRGIGMVFISSELPELMALSDRILTMYEGEITGEFVPEKSPSEDILHAMMGGKQKAAV